MANYNSKIVLGNGEVLIDLTADTVTADKLLSGYTAHGKDGAPITGACSFDADTSDADAAAAELLLNKTAYVNGNKLTGSMPNRGGIAGSISTKAEGYVIPQGYHDGSGTVSIAQTEQAKLVAGNIRQGVTILGVEGSMSGSEDVSAQAVNATPTFAQQVITPDTTQGYNYLSQVTVAAIPVVRTENAAGGYTVTVG